MDERTRNALKIALQNLPAEPERRTREQLEDAVRFARAILDALLKDETGQGA